jgi:GNAT superfamily N-acetyltransferase
VVSVALVRRVRSDEHELLRTTRLAALKDAPYAFGSTYAAESGRPDTEWEARARAGAEGAERATFFAAADGEIVGLVGGVRADGQREVVDLVSMWTEPAARRRGVGRALVHAVLDWARATNATAVELWVTQGNGPAQHLYESLGFRATGVTQPLPSDPAHEELRMRLDL